MITTTTLTSLVRQIERIRGIRKADLLFGDCLIVDTRNSSYRIVSLGNGLFRVSGGWFDRTGASPTTTSINGCTWGGSAIHADLAAGQGLFLEFGNKVVTTRIRQYQLIRSGQAQVIH
jgi:hypothetical protein